jgi:hypothetical protein
MTNRNCLILAADAFHQDEKALDVINFLLKAMSDRKETIQVFLAYLVHRKEESLLAHIISSNKLELEGCLVKNTLVSTFNGDTLLNIAVLESNEQIMKLLI